jgi:hypothetical protein
MRYVKQAILWIVLLANPTMGMDAKQSESLAITEKPQFITHIFLNPLPAGIQRVAMHLPGVQTIESERNGGFFQLKAPIDINQQYAKYRNDFPHFSSTRDSHNCSENCKHHPTPMTNGAILGVATNTTASEEDDYPPIQELFEGKLFLTSNDKSKGYQAPFIHEITSPILRIELVKLANNQMTVIPRVSVVKVTPAS